MNHLYFQWHITDACNFRCRHCYQSKFSPSLELDIKGLKVVADKIIAEARQQKAKVVINITGGEPFLKKELFSLLAYLDKHKEIEELLIITNGSLVGPELIKKLKRVKKLKQIKVSLEGADKESNDAIRGRGAFDKAIKGIQLLKGSGFLITVMFTAMKSNLCQLKGVYELCKKSGVSGLIVERFFPIGRGSGIKEQLLDRKDWFGLVNTLFEASGCSYSERDEISQRAYWVRFFKKKAELWSASCNVGRDSFCIMPNADVYPCRRFIFKLGNLLENPPAEMINSASLSDIIQGKPKGRCFECDITECRRCPGLAYLLTGDYHASDSQCWYGATEASNPPHSLPLVRLGQMALLVLFVSLR